MKDYIGLQYQSFQGFNAVEWTVWGFPSKVRTRSLPLILCTTKKETRYLVALFWFGEQYTPCIGMCCYSSFTKEPIGCQF